MQLREIPLHLGVPTERRNSAVTRTSTFLFLWTLLPRKASSTRTVLPNLPALPALRYVPGHLPSSRQGGRACAWRLAPTMGADRGSGAVLGFTVKTRTIVEKDPGTLPV